MLATVKKLVMAFGLSVAKLLSTFNIDRRNGKAPHGTAVTLYNPLSLCANVQTSVNGL
jgi:hypothetical protein